MAEPKFLLEQVAVEGESVIDVVFFVLPSFSGAF